MTQAIPISFYATPPHDCNYLPGRIAVTVFADPRAAMDMHLYSALINHGYRRSGSHVYAPHCPECQSCRSMRLRVEDFHPDRSQRRNWKMNLDLQVTPRPAEFKQEHFDLYRKYIASRHTGGGMDDTDPDKYREFLMADWCDTEFVEFRLEGRLLAVSVVDCVDIGLSAVYTYFDPDDIKRGLGTFAILWQVEEARRRQLPYVYLGYWIEESEKMAYKARFRPNETFQQGIWLQNI